MLNQDNLNTLFELATGSKPAQVGKKVVSLREQAAKDSASKIKDLHGTYSKLYSDPHEAWIRWYEDSNKNISSDNANEVWNHAEQNHPSGPEAARKYLRTRIDTASDNNDPALAESNLRNQMSKSPDWLVEEKTPKLNNLSSMVANQNMVKAKKIYESSLNTKLTSLDLSQLDPDVPMEVHEQDLLKCELLGVLDGAQVVNGRIAVSDGRGGIQPAFNIDSGVDSQLDSTDPEMKLIYSTAPNIIRDHVQTAISEANMTMATDNRAASGVGVGMLEDGMPVDQWGDAMSLVNGDKQGTIRAGIKGLVKNNDLTHADIAMHASDIMTRYGGLDQ